MMFFSCTELPDENNDNGNDNGDDSNDPVGSTELVLLASEMIIHANGEDAVEFTVLSNGHDHRTRHLFVLGRIRDLAHGYRNDYRDRLPRTGTAGRSRA